MDREDGKTGGREDETAQSVAALAELYLGNLLYALERCAMSLEAAGDAEAAAFYRGLARAFADAHGAAKR